MPLHTAILAPKATMNRTHRGVEAQQIEQLPFLGNTGKA
jgi:hypothetical protein